MRCGGLDNGRSQTPGRPGLFQLSLQFVVVHPGVGLFVGLPELLAVFGDCGPYRNAQNEIIAATLINGCLALTEPFHQLLCRNCICIRKYDREFIAADPGNQVLAAEGLLQSLGSLFYEPVTLGVSETVVNELQTIYIRDQDTYRELAA